MTKICNHKENTAPKPLTAQEKKRAIITTLVKIADCTDKDERDRLLNEQPDWVLNGMFYLASKILAAQKEKNNAGM